IGALAVLCCSSLIAGGSLGWSRNGWRDDDTARRDTRRAVFVRGTDSCQATCPTVHNFFSCPQIAHEPPIWGLTNGTLEEGRPPRSGGGCPPAGEIAARWSIGLRLAGAGSSGRVGQWAV